MTDNPAVHHHIAIIGTGFGGVAAAIRLDRAGLNDFVLLERADEVGGVWRDNGYPGAAVDVQCQLYSYSFAPNAEWGRVYATQPEILGYLRDVTQRFGLRGRMVLNCGVERLDWDSVRQCWRLRTARGERTADHVVIATGALADPAIPSLIGLGRFAGASFHSARWDHNFDPAGKRIAVIGTGASAVQFIPAIQPEVAHLAVFQRTPAWVIPRHDRKISSTRQFLMRVLPALQRLERLRLYLVRERILLAFRRPTMLGRAERSARRYLETQVNDGSLRTKLLPDYRLGCKRVLVSDDYLATLDQPNVTLITDGIREIDEDGVIDVTGTHHPVDAIIFGTGFRTSRLPLTDQIYGRDGRSMTEVWDGNPTAYLGTTVSGFPNCYLVHGPNIGVGHTSMIYMYESQANYIAGAISYARNHSIGTVEPTPAAQSAFTAEVDRLSEGTVWTSGGCTSWYLNENGRNINIWPGSTLGYRRRTMRFDASQHVLHRTNAPVPAL
ncbi:NAD(P)/FAD-dependent oxidoreductase [Mycolicibacterium sp. CH28]|uniref:flavin-containing monooxygenase n=1 Tax=Mycolicibacterium sp. CH28 TaxID=2512237 RepID=UPI001F2CED2C|nr:NAD(P)/FAD-dependent oxidoreductase [Mycolicibacterium sp. CH28]